MEDIRTPKGKPLLRDGEAKAIIEAEKELAGSPSIQDLLNLKPDNGQFRKSVDLICEGYDLIMAIRQL